jgi:hypothetical protein
MELISGISVFLELQVSGVRFQVSAIGRQRSVLSYQLVHVEIRAGCMSRSRLKNVPQGLKPHCLCAFRGTAKAVPFQNRIYAASSILVPGGPGILKPET